MNTWIKKITEKYDRCIAWGAGYYFQKYHEIFDESIDYIIDSAEEKQDKILAGHSVYPPSMLAEENPDRCLVIVFNANFDELCKSVQRYGNFDIIDASVFWVICDAEDDREVCNAVDNDKKQYVLVVCGMLAFLGINGARKFIDSQNDIIHKNGFQTIEVIPLENYMQNGINKNYVMACIERKCLGVFTPGELAEKYPIVQTVIIHSLYYQHEILEQILFRISVKKKILYYLHDYYCICNYRFFYNQDKKCLDKYDRLICDKCINNDVHKSIMEFHNKLFRKYSIILIAPSDDTALRVKKHLYYDNVIVIPHLAYIEKEKYFKQKTKKRIAYVGCASFMKGWEGYCKLFGSLSSKYEFYCMGRCPERQKRKGITYIDISLDSKENNMTMVETLNKYDIDIAYIGSIWPETYSYTYYEAYEAGCFVITTLNSGNVCDQVNRNQNGLSFESVEDMQLWLEDTELVQKNMDKFHRCIYKVRPNEKFMAYIYD